MDELKYNSTSSWERIFKASGRELDNFLKNSTQVKIKMIIPYRFAVYVYNKKGREMV